MSIPLNIDWQQILLHLFNFAILGGGLYLLLYRPVKQFMERRQTHYEDLYRQAEQDRARAERLREEYQARLDQADAAIARKKADAEKELNALLSQRIDEAKQQAEEILAKAREGADREEREMVSKASRELVGIAVTAAEKIALGAEGDPYEQFLNLAERRASHEQQSQ